MQEQGLVTAAEADKPDASRGCTTKPDAEGVSRTGGSPGGSPDEKTGCQCMPGYSGNLTDLNDSRYMPYAIGAA